MYIDFDIQQKHRMFQNDTKGKMIQNPISHNAKSYQGKISCYAIALPKAQDTGKKRFYI